MSFDVSTTANHALEEMLRAGFDDAQVSAAVSEQDELNIMHNEPSLLRSTEDHSLSLMGIVDGRKAVMALTDLSPGATSKAVSELFERAKLAPSDEANAVSADQKLHFEQGPVEADPDQLATKAEELIAYRAEKTPLMQIEEGGTAHRVTRESVLTSRGSELSCIVGSYEMSVFGAATDGENTSSFNYLGGRTNDLSGAHASDQFGIGQMMAETENQIHTKPVDGNFVGEIILAPTAVGDLLGWLFGNLSDMALIGNTSLFRDSVGQVIASKLLSIRSQFDAPGHAPYSGDAFVTEPLTVVENGKLNYLLPGLYGSRKTGIKHVPSSSGWKVDPGKTSRSEMIAGIQKGAMVNRLSMGSPGPGGDFSGVIKNSFIIENGELGHGLSETMIAGNMAEMLQNIIAVSSEHLDLGGQDFPWISISDLNFS